MKKMILLLSLLIIAMFLVGCVETTEEVSDEELETELSQLSDEELDQAIETAEVADTDAALVGQANRQPKVPKHQFLASAYKVRLKRIQLMIPTCQRDTVGATCNGTETLICINNVSYDQSVSCFPFTCEGSYPTAHCN